MSNPISPTYFMLLTRAPDSNDQAVHTVPPLKGKKGEFLRLSHPCFPPHILVCDFGWQGRPHQQGRDHGLLHEGQLHLLQAGPRLSSQLPGDNLPEAHFLRQLCWICKWF